MHPRTLPVSDSVPAGSAALLVVGIVSGLLLLAGTPAAAQSESWQPAEAPLMTRWADEVSPETVTDRPYPRPQMKRSQWQTLNGLWQYAIVDRGRDVSAFEGDILVPFSVESALSGVGTRVTPEQELVYHRTFTVPSDWADDRILLHVGAADWRAEVLVNGQVVGQHRGGYDPFQLDVTDALEEGGSQDLTIRVWDPTDHGPQPRGKQVRNPGGIWYTPVTGLWRTVWLEPVPADGHIRDLSLEPVPNDEVLRVRVDGRGAEDLTVEAVARAKDGSEVGRASGSVAEPIEVPVPKPTLWSPSTPYLYDLDVRLRQNGETVDSVDSYFGMRTIGLGAGPDGTTRITLNGDPLFQYGPLDQGYWPDGLYTPPTEDAMAYDLEVTKELGFNMTRKHVKVEPRRWYYMADSLGLLVWQDMPSTMAGPESTPDLQRTEEEYDQFETELQEMIDDYYNHPSIVLWIVFNEGWGQYDTERLTAMVEEQDPTRLVSNASGWTDHSVGDVRDVHAYPGPGAPPPEEDRAIVLGEFGGRGLPISGHTWQDEANWGHAGTTDTPVEMMDVYQNQLEELRPLLSEPGLSGAVYTQITDVEIEVNGLLTYDRDVIKMNTHRLASLNRRLYQEPPPRVETLVPTARQETTVWRYTTSRPANEWTTPDFEAQGWAEGPGGFGTAETPGAHVGTEWSSSDLWVRRTFSHEGPTPENLHLWIHHDDAATVYLNGQQIAELNGWSSSYQFVSLGLDARRAWRQGENTLAIHVQQEDGGQYIDAGFVDITERESSSP